ncbi:MAG: dTDP-4-dehydrorhamnose 3,5-epimerase [Bacteroidetes bacterium]|nr:dTDP-4-dehydrorhamnose 3,5-epimerase [Bacteroidota bacterium]
MQVIPTSLSGLFIIQPKVFEDARGYFFESYNKEFYYKQGIKTEFVQDNQSLSQKDVLRGLHFQNPPHAQAKLVRVITGAVLDAAVDIRKNSPTYGKYVAEILSEKNKTMMFIPEGFAHGFLVLEDNTIFSYKCSGVYNTESEDAILWNDAAIGINWGIKNPVLSEKDRIAQQFKDFESKFSYLG